MTTDRLTREQWLDHGLLSLADSGFTSLKADKLAKSLGVSRGSFYWHFKNLADFHSAILGRWQEVASENVISMLENEAESAVTKLHQLLNIAVKSEQTLEQAIRAWAENDAAVKHAVMMIDKLRMSYVEKLLQEMGGNREQSLIRARIIYSSYLGQLILHDEMTADQQNKLIDELMTFAQF